MTSIYQTVEDISKLVKEEISDITGLALDKIDENLTWEDYLFDSVNIAALADNVSRKLHIEIDFVDMYKLANIRDCIMHLAGLIKKQ